jgi:hypothetical protein
MKPGAFSISLAVKDRLDEPGWRSARRNSPERMAPVASPSPIRMGTRILIDPHL